MTTTTATLRRKFEFVSPSRQRVIGLVCLALSFPPG
jgi:hypothetical protein